MAKWRRKEFVQFDNFPSIQNIANSFHVICKFFLIQNSDKELESYIKEVFSQDSIHKIITSCRNLPKENVYFGISLLTKILSLNNDDKPFANQFVFANGMNLISRFQLLNPETPESHFSNEDSLIDTVNLLIQVARSSKEYYDSIHSIDPYQNIYSLFKTNSVNLKAKLCNLLGNMCRHSPFFYENLKKHKLIQCLILGLKEKDVNVKKFASFAVGNAGFHNDMLYEELRPAIPYLTELLNDSDEKTRANAAGALGNFVRNSRALVVDIVSHGAVEQMIKMISCEKPNVCFITKSYSPIKIALFSLGSFCPYPESRKIMEEFNVKKIAENYLVLDLTKAPLFTKDPVIIKYARRLLQKITSSEKK